MDEFPGNSRRRLEEKNEPSATEAVEPKFEKVITGTVIKRKKPLGRRLMETFFSTDSSSVVGYLGKEVLLPALQNLVIDFVTQGIEKAVHGEVQTPRRSARGSTSGPRTHISYDRPSSIVRSSTSITPSSAPRRVVTQPSAFDIGEVILGTKIEAQVIAEKLGEAIEEYGAVTVANLNELIGQTSAYTDHKWGWTDLVDLRIKRVTEGYLLVLPEPEDLR